MDPVTLATAATTLLAPYISKMGEKLMDNIAEKMPEKMGKLWETISHRFNDNSAATNATSDLVKNAANIDYQEAFTLQLKQVLKEDEDFASLLTDLLEQARNEANITISGDGVVAMNNSLAAREINVGNVSGNLTIGNNGQVNSK